MTRVHGGMVAVAAAGALALAGCGGGSGGSAETPPPTPKQVKETQAATAGKADYHGGVLQPAKAAPPLQLADSTGKPFGPADMQGKTLLVTFIYSHCPDTCPLIVSNLRTAQAKLTPAERANLQIVGVSTDPEGDTPKAVNAFLKRMGMEGRMRYLIGSRKALKATWRNWGILAKADPKDPDSIEHSALIYGIGSNGEITTIYPANFKPADVAHDVPLLEGL